MYACMPCCLIEEQHKHPLGGGGCSNITRKETLRKSGCLTEPMLLQARPTHYIPTRQALMRHNIRQIHPLVRRFPLQGLQLARHLRELTRLTKISPLLAIAVIDIKPSRTQSLRQRILTRTVPLQNFCAETGSSGNPDDSRKAIAVRSCANDDGPKADNYSECREEDGKAVCDPEGCSVVCVHCLS
jgi:hypothetical protein